MFTCILALFETNKCLIVPLCSLPKAATNVTFLGSIRYSRKMRRQPSAKNRCHSSFPLQYFTPRERAALYIFRMSWGDILYIHSEKRTQRKNKQNLSHQKNFLKLSRQ